MSLRAADCCRRQNKYREIIFLKKNANLSTRQINQLYSITEITRQRAVSERLRDNVLEREARFQKVSLCLTIYPLCCLSGMLIHVSMIQLKLHRNSNIEEKYIALKNTLDDISMVPMISECSFQNIKSHDNQDAGHIHN